MTVGHVGQAIGLCRLSGVVQDKRVVSGWTGDKRRSPVLRAGVEGKRAAEVQQRPSPNATVARPAPWTYEAAVDVLGQPSVAVHRRGTAKELRHYSALEGARLAFAPAARGYGAPR